MRAGRLRLPRGHAGCAVVAAAALRPTCATQCFFPFPPNYSQTMMSAGWDPQRLAARVLGDVRGLETHSLREQQRTEQECVGFYAAFRQQADADQFLASDDDKEVNGGNACAARSAGGGAADYLKGAGAGGEATSERQERALRMRAQLAVTGVVDVRGRCLLVRHRHVAYLRRGLERLSSGMACLDASRPWLCYWMLHGLELLGAPPVDLGPRCVSFLRRCHALPRETGAGAADGGNAFVSLGHGCGGFGGGPGQLSHCAPSYAAVLALCTIGTPAALAALQDCRVALYHFYLRMKSRHCGGFRMHRDGEVDARGTYTAVAVAYLLNMLTPEFAAGAAEFLLRCQTFEGGFGGEPGNEAHGGYAFCALAALHILGAAQRADLKACARWVGARQMRLEGGFQGRANKLVDGCYSFWQGAIPAVLARCGLGSPAALLLDRERLQQYLLLCCQDVQRGGLRDKPSKHRDFYHTCYCLSGLSVAQHGVSGAASAHDRRPVVWGSPTNLLAETDPVFNISAQKLAKAREHFASLPCSHEALLTSGGSR